MDEFGISFATLEKESNVARNREMNAILQKVIMGKLKRRTLSDRIIYTIGKISKVCYDDGLFQAQRLGLIDSLIDDAETAAHEIDAKDAEIERLQAEVVHWKTFAEDTEEHDWNPESV